MKKVFVLSIYWSVDYETGMKVRAFDDIIKARKALKEDYDEVHNDYAEWAEDFDDDCASLYEEGEYTRNHCEWQIDELDVE